MAKLTLSDIAAGYTSVSTINANNALVEAAMENTLSRDGTSPNTMSANLDMNSNQVKNVTDPTDDQDASTKGYVDDLVATSVAGQITGTFSVGTSWDWTAQQDFWEGFRIGNTAQTEYVSVVHDGTNTITMTPNGAGVTAWQIKDMYQYLRGSYGTIYLSSDNSTQHFRIGDNGVDGQISQIGVLTNLDFIGWGALDLKGNTKLNFYDGANEDFGEIYHDDSALSITTAGTGGGSVDIKLESGGASTGIVLDDVVFMQERAAAKADRAGYGQIWVKSDTPNTLWFTDDAGTDFEVAVAASGNSGSVTCNGFTTSPATTWFFNREGNMVRARANLTVSATSNTQEMGFSAGTIPAAFRPAGEVNMVYPITDNGAVSMGLIQFNTDGSIDFFKGAYPNTASTFTASGTKGFSNNIEVIYYLTAS